MGYFSDLVDAPATQDQPSLFSPFQAAADRVRQAQMPVGGRRESLPQPIRDFNGQPISDRAPDDYLNDLKDPETRAQLVEKIAPLAMSMTPGPSKGIKAYHGSPYDFDRFDLNKIGTGEGAQAYGHGLYFAENEGVARNYRDALAGKSQLKTDNGIIDVQNITDPGQRLAANAIKDSASPEHARMLINSFAKANREYGPAALREFERLQEINAKPNPGNMYEVNINAHPDQFLDWDKALLDQSPNVKGALEQFRQVPGAEPLWSISGQPRQALPGEAAFRQLSKVAGGPVAVSEALRDAGVPGIKYLDQGSRFGGPSDKTSNYVVFNDQLIDILRKYGILGPAAVGAASGIQRGEDD